MSCVSKLENLAAWVANYAKQADKSVLVVGFRGTRADALILRICSLASEISSNLSTHVLSFPTKIQTKHIFTGKTTLLDRYIGDEDAYYKCHLVSGDTGLIVGPIDQTFGLYYRSYGKRAEASADIFPLFNLTYSDIINMVADPLIGLPFSDWEDQNYKMYQHADQSNLIDLCTEAEAKFGIITYPDPPNTHPRWPYFIASQKQIIATVHQREKSTRHKKLTKPYPGNVQDR